LELWCARYSIENSEELQTNSEPPDGSQTPFGTPLKKENPLYTGLIERITSTTFTRRMVGSCEPLSYAVSDTSLSSPLPSSFHPPWPQHWISTTAVHVINDTLGHARSFKLVFERSGERNSWGEGEPSPTHFQSSNSVQGEPVFLPHRHGLDLDRKRLGAIHDLRFSGSIAKKPLRAPL